MVFSALTTSFILGVLTPITAVCVLPLFPGFIAFLTQQTRIKSRYAPAIMGLLVAAGVILFMLLFGIIFSTILEVALTTIIAYLSPPAMILLLIISILLLFDYDFAKLFPHINAPESKNPYWSALLFGLFFGAIVIPCQPGFLAAMFAKTLITGAAGFALNLANFFAFGIGMALPLLFFSLLSLRWSHEIMRFLTKNKSIINRLAGALMLVLVLYFLFFDFQIHKTLF